MKYTMEDIGNFIIDYREAQGFKPHEIMLSIPKVGRAIYQKACLEEQKRQFFEGEYKKAISGSDEEQQVFIEKMTPVLDSFYGVSDKTEVRNR